MSLKFKNYSLEIPVIISAVVIFILGIEPFIPQLYAFLPASYVKEVSSVTGIILILAHAYHNRPSRTLAKVKVTDIEALAEVILPTILAKVSPDTTPEKIKEIQDELTKAIALENSISPLAKRAIEDIKSGITEVK